MLRIYDYTLERSKSKMPPVTTIECTRWREAPRLQIHLPNRFHFSIFQFFFNEAYVCQRLCQGPPIIGPFGTGKGMLG